MFRFRKGGVQPVVDDDGVETGGEAQFVCGFGEPFFDFLGRVRTPACQAFAEGINGWGLDEDGECLCSEFLFDVQPAEDVHVKEHGIAFCPDALHFAVESAVITAGIDFFVFEEIARGNAVFEVFRGEEVVFLAVLFRAPGGTAGG